jgi:hypothetical protein
MAAANRGLDDAGLAAYLQVTPARLAQLAALPEPDAADPGYHAALARIADETGCNGERLDAILAAARVAPRNSD